MKRAAIPIAFFAACIAAWQWASTRGGEESFVLPPPSRVFAYLWDSVKEGTILPAAFLTMRRLAVGFAIGGTIGLPLGLFAARFRAVSDTLGTLALGLQTLPSVCWVPLALLWFGPTEGAILFVVVMGTLWAILIATANGVRSLPPIYARAARTMGSRRFHTMFFVTLPASMPFVLAGMKQGWAFAWRSLMAAEIYVTILTGFGLGHLLHYGRELHAMDQVLGVMMVIVAVGLLTEFAVFGQAERMLRRRFGTGTA